MSSKDNIVPFISKKAKKDHKDIEKQIEFDKTLIILKKEVNGLKELLDNPKPGLSSWMLKYVTRVNNITAIWMGKDPDELA